MSSDNAPEREPKVGGPVDPEDNLYISRQVDAEFIALLKAREFVNLIEAQRGFQANSRVITTTDQILSELMNIVR